MHQCWHKSLLFISIGSVLYVWNKIFGTNVGHTSSKLDKKKVSFWKHHAPTFGDKSQQLLRHQIKFYL